VNARIQIDTLKSYTIPHLLETAQVQIPPALKGVIHPEQTVQAAPPKTLTAADLAVLYGDKVQPHRFAFAEVKNMMMTASSLTNAPMIQGMPTLNISDIMSAIQKTSGDTTFEQLTCVGLNPNQDTLVGTIKLKLANGYSGDLCTAGSREYVAFWLDWGDGAGWTYVGVTSVVAHDISSIPADGLQYSVFLPVALTPLHIPCDEGPKIAKVRAVLSWQAVPPPSNPDYVPTWGNNLNSLIQLRPGISTQPTGHTPFIETVGSMAVSSISNATGLANGPAVAVGFTATDSPFGGLVVVTGHIANPPDVLGGGATPFKYRVSVSNDGINWISLNDPFTIWLTELNNGVWSGPSPFNEIVDAEGWYTYMEDLTTGPNNPMRFVAQNVLAQWQTAGKSGLWKIKMETKDTTTNSVFPGTQVIAICLDNTAPSASITITSGGGPCADFQVGDPITGTYSVSDEHFGSLSLSVQPALGGTFTDPTPPYAPMIQPRAYPTVPTTGETGGWRLDTTTLPKCGYVVYLGVYDRTIVNSGGIGFYNQANVGLCLRQP